MTTKKGELSALDLVEERIVSAALVRAGSNSNAGAEVDRVVQRVERCIVEWRCVVCGGETHYADISLIQNITNYDEDGTAHLTVRLGRGMLNLNCQNKSRRPSFGTTWVGRD